MLQCNSICPRTCFNKKYLDYDPKGQGDLVDHNDLLDYLKCQVDLVGLVFDLKDQDNW